MNRDDRIIDSIEIFKDKDIIISVKMDGECTSLYKDKIHARSINYSPHPSRSWIKSLHANINSNIPKGWRIVGENLYAKHSIKYNNLDSYFLVFAIFNERNICLSWADTKTYSILLGLQTVPVLYKGLWGINKVKQSFYKEYDGDPMEGYVVRLANSFAYHEYSQNVAKYVRQNHVQTDEHWIHKPIELNQLKKLT